MSAGPKKKPTPKKVESNDPMGVIRGVRLYANTNKNLVHHARILVARHVPDGEDGTIQDLINYVFSALTYEPALCDRLYRKGKELYPKIKDTPVAQIIAERDNVENN